MKNSKRMITILASLMAVTMLATGCAEQSEDTVNTGNTSVSSQAQSSDSSAELTGTDNAKSSKTGRNTQTINIDPGTEETESSDADASSPWDKTTSSESESDTAVTAVSSVNGKLDTSDMFSKRDLNQTADLSEAKSLTVSDGETIDITEAGVYVISGSASDCTIKVNCSDENAKVQLVLDNVSITNSDFPAIYVVSADKVFVTTADGSSNTLSVTGSFKADGDTNTDAVIYSRDDLVLNGLGTLTVNSASGNGITSKDDLKVTGGTYNITSALDAIEANDSVRISGGTFSITSSKDGIHAENSDDDSKGYVYISGGTFSISARSDGIQATSVLQIDGGSFEILASEGLESTYIQINGGELKLTSTDDGVNASQKSQSVGTPTFEMTGGTLTISMSSGDTDAIDANGSVIVSGGTIDITSPLSGPSESFDYDGTATYTGGTIIVNGETLSEIPTPAMMGGGGFGGGGQRGGFGGDGFGGGGRGRMN